MLASVRLAQEASRGRCRQEGRPHFFAGQHACTGRAPNLFPPIPSPLILGPLGRLSAALGWASTGCWWFGWYPQLAKNFLRRSVAGVSLTYLAWNLTGFLSYAIFNCALYFSPSIRAAYRAAHGGVDSDVRSNDVFFSVHALLMTMVAAGQAAVYGAGGETLSVAAAAGVGGAVASVAVYARLWAAGTCGCVGALALLNMLATVKVRRE